jgi:hypothetical protein
MYFDVQADATLPFSLAFGGHLRPGSTLLLEDNWRSRGAQVHPRPFLRIGNEAFENLLETQQLVYHGGDLTNPVYLVRVRG